MSAPSPLDYLRVDRYLGEALQVRALTTAFELGIVDLLAAPEPATRDRLRSTGIDAFGLELLLGLLAANGVLDDDGQVVRFTDDFRTTLAFRDLLEAKLEILAVVGPDILEQFTAMVAEPDRFMAETRVFRLFDYRRALTPSADNDAWTRRWVRLTTALTRYEAGVCLEAFDFSAFHRLLDVGGNSGEFARRICAAHPGMTATVLDLPVVCAIGERHLHEVPERDRIAFVAGDAIHGALPPGADLITFKSMLHDWPDAEAELLLGRAFDALMPGGRLLVFERAPLDLRAPLRYSLLPTLVFARWLRNPERYVEWARARGFVDISVRTMALETPFLLVTAGRPA